MKVPGYPVLFSLVVKHRVWEFDKMLLNYGYTVVLWTFDTLRHVMLLSSVSK